MGKFFERLAVATAYALIGFGVVAAARVMLGYTWGF